MKASVAQSHCHALHYIDACAQASFPVERHIQNENGMKMMFPDSQPDVAEGSMLGTRVIKLD